MTLVGSSAIVNSTGEGSRDCVGIGKCGCYLDLSGHGRPCQWVMCQQKTGKRKASHSVNIQGRPFLAMGVYSAQGGWERAWHG